MGILTTLDQVIGVCFAWLYVFVTFPIQIITYPIYKLFNRNAKWWHTYPYRWIYIDVLNCE